MGCTPSKELTEKFLDNNEELHEKIDSVIDEYKREKEKSKKFEEIIDLFKLLILNNDPNSLVFKDIEKYKETSLKRREILQKYFNDSFELLERSS
jgi:hypothetical protein